MRELRPVETIGRVAAPILLYGLLAMIYPGLMGTISGGRLLKQEAGMWLLSAGNFLMLPVFWVMYRRDRKERESYGLQGHGIDQAKRPAYGWKFRDLFLVILGAVCISRGVNDFLALTFLPRLFPGYERFTEEMLSGSLLSQIMAGVISAPLLEEVLMRGLIYGRLKEGVKSPRTAMLLSALIFGLFHGNVVQGLYAFVVGLFFALVFEVYDSLTLAVLAHMAVNLAAVAVAGADASFFRYRNLGVYYLLTAGFLIAGMACVRFFLRRL